MTLTKNTVQWLDKAFNGHLKRVFALILAVGTITLGLVFIIAGDIFLREPTFRLMFLFGTPFGWGCLMILTSVALAAFFLNEPKGASLASLALTLLYLTMAICLGFGIPNGGVPSASVIYMVVALFSAAITIAYAVEKQ